MIMTPTDRKLLGALLVLGLLLWGGQWFWVAQNQPERVIIKVQGEVVHTSNLQAGQPSQEIVVEGKIGTAIIEIAGEKVRMYQAPCPQQICVAQGWLTATHGALVCLPNEVVVYLERASLDGISG